MKHGVFLAGLSVLGFFLMACGSPLCPQEAPAKKKAKANEIEGIWTQVHCETDGDSTPGMINPNFISGYIWKFSKEEVGSGFGFPLRDNYHYQLNPGGKMGEIDMIPLDNKGKKIA